MTSEKDLDAQLATEDLKPLGSEEPGLNSRVLRLIKRNFSRPTFSKEIVFCSMVTPKLIHPSISKLI